MQRSIQCLDGDDPHRKDLLMDIGIEELSHLEVIGTLARMHLDPLKSDRNAASEYSLIAIAEDGGVNLFHSMGNGWTGNSLQIICELDADLRSKSESETRLRTSHQFN